MKNIRIEWDGPYTLDDIGYYETADVCKYELKNAKLNDDCKDYGVYQVYGAHPIYGNDVLLYIGQAAQQTFAKRLSQEGWEYNQDYKNVKLYVGRLFSEQQPVSLERWDELIDIAEKMLIFSHEPARNSSNILNVLKNKNVLKRFEDIRIFNYDNYRSLMPEISGELWIKDFSEKYSGVFDTNKIK
jgi:hypothetical protein